MTNKIDKKTIITTVSIGALIFLALISVSKVNISTAEENEDKDPILLISTIRTLLDQSLIEFKAENFTGAEELVDIAYIDHYEFVEDPLKELDKKLMKETEIMIREDYADAIDDKDSEEVSSLLDQIMINLDKAEELFLAEE